MKCLGIIAGGGKSPVIAAQNAGDCGWRVVVSVMAETGAKFPASAADMVREISLAKAGEMRDYFKSEGVTDVIIIGKVEKTLNFASHDFDETALGMLSRLAGRGDIQIAQVVIEELESLGFHVRQQTEFMDDHLLPEGVLCGVVSDMAAKDIEKGLEVARSLAAHDIGQTVVVREGAVIAVEAFEHTDATVQRAGTLVAGQLTVVKVARPNQDLRFDVPTIGAETIRVLSEAGAKTLAAQAQSTIWIDKEKTIQLAEDLGIAIVGIKYS